MLKARFAQTAPDLRPTSKTKVKLNACRRGPGGSKQEPNVTLLLLIHCWVVLTRLPNSALIEVIYKTVGDSYKQTQAEHTPSLVYICGDSVCILPNAKTLAHQSVHGEDATCIQQHAQSGRYLCLVLQCKIA